MSELEPDPIAKKFTDHLKKFGEHMTPCPICTGKRWNFVGIILERVNARSTTSSEIPIARLVCDACYFIRDFAWKPIETPENKN